MAGETLGASFSIDVTELKAGLAQANRMIRESESEFKAAAAGMDDWRKSEEGLSAKIKSLNTITEVQKEKVNALQSEYDRMIAEGMDPASKAAVELRTKINNETASLNKNETELKKQKDALENFGKEAEDAGESAEDMGDAAEESGDKLSLLKAAGGVAVKAIAAVGAACVSAVGAFFGLAESTRESRNSMAQLETAFQSAGLSAEAAESTLTSLYGIIGDEGAATEAAQQLAKMSKDEADLAANTRILTGVMAEYGNSIPTEGLAEGMAATAAMGEVQGVLADALEWQGVNLEKYNEKLSTLKTEEERAAYIQSTLTDLYGESADAYRENNAEVIAANEAQAELNATLNELGAIAEPIMTTLKQLATDLLSSLTPFVALMGEGLAGALEGADGAADSLAAGLSGLINTLLAKLVEMLPFVLDTIIAIVPQLLSSLLEQLPVISATLLQMVEQVAGLLETLLPAQLPTIVSVLVQILAQIATSIGNMLPILIPTIVDAVVLIVETLLDNTDLLIDAGIQLLVGLTEGLLAALPRLIEKIPVIIDKAVAAIVRNLPKILQAGVQILVQLVRGIEQAIPQLVSKIPQIISTITSGLKSSFSDIKEIGKDIIKGLWNGINDMAGWIAKKIKGFGENVLGGIKDFFGINSPSKVMADEVGKNLALGIGEGFEKNIASVNSQITGAMNWSGAASGGASRAGGAVVNQYNYYSQAHSRVELYKTKQATAAAVRLAMAGA